MARSLKRAKKDLADEEWTEDVPVAKPKKKIVEEEWTEDVPVAKPKKKIVEEEWTEDAPVAKPKKEKKAKVTAEEDADAWAVEPKKKKSKVAKVPKGTPAKPEDLETGTVVLYWDGWRGTVRDAFVPLDEFWITDEESGEMVRDDNGDVYAFKSAELQLVAAPPVAPPMPQGEGRGPAGGVLIIGSESQMLRMLNHFGTPDPKERRQPQMLLALPCSVCDPDSILAVASEGVEPSVRKLARKLRPDIEVALRAFHLKQAVQELGADLMRMESFYIMSSVQVPYSREEFEKYTGWDRRWREEVCNQIDIGVTSLGLYQLGDATEEDTARRTLGENCGVVISLPLWDEEVQTTLRRQLDVSLPLQITDANGMRISVLILPHDCIISIQEGILGFTESPDADYLAGEDACDEDAGADEDDDAEEDDKPGETKVQGKTIQEWEKEQAMFKGQPELPSGWLRIKSRKSGEVYFWNKRTQEATFTMPEAPLPEGWTKQVSKSTGKTYYFNAAKRASQFDRPKA